MSLSQKKRQDDTLGVFRPAGICFVNVGGCEAAAGVGGYFFFFKNCIRFVAGATCIRYFSLRCFKKSIVMFFEKHRSHFIKGSCAFATQPFYFSLTL